MKAAESSPSIIAIEKKKEKFVSNIFWHIAASLECRPIISRVCCKEEGVAGVVYPSSDALVSRIVNGLKKKI